MGFFSWIDVNNKENITDMDKEVTLLIPEKYMEATQEFIDIRLDNRGLTGKYNGYGIINGVDVYDVAAFLNICACENTEFEQTLKNLFSEKEKELCRQIRNEYEEGYYEYDEEDETSGIMQLYDKHDTQIFRNLGIEICGNNKRNAAAPYPIKLTLDETSTYETSDFSMRDPNQGFTKFKDTAENEKEHDPSVYEDFINCKEEKRKILEELEKDKEDIEQEKE